MGVDGDDVGFHDVCDEIAFFCQEQILGSHDTKQSTVVIRDITSVDLGGPS